MTEIEMMQAARVYVDKMANGVDPLTDRAVAETDCLNQVRISRCLFYVSDVLGRVIESGGKTGGARKAAKQPFAVSYELLEHFPLSDTPITVSEMSKRLNELAEPGTMTKLKTTSITGFLMESGLLEAAPAADGSTYKVPTEQGRSIGISVEERTGRYGRYRVTLYNIDAQQFILDNIEAVIALNGRKAEPGTEKAENQGRPWTAADDEMLAEMFGRGASETEIAAALKRTVRGVQARVKRMR